MEIALHAIPILMQLLSAGMRVECIPRCKGGCCQHGEGIIPTYYAGIIPTYVPIWTINT